MTLLLKSIFYRIKKNKNRSKREAVWTLFQLSPLMQVVGDFPEGFRFKFHIGASSNELNLTRAIPLPNILRQAF